MEPSGLRCRQWKLRITGIKGRRIRRSPQRQRWQIDDFLPTQSTSAQDCILGDFQLFLRNRPLAHANPGLTSLCENRQRNSRSLHCATPDFLSNLVALANFMRLSLRKAAHAAMSSAAWQEIRVRSGRDDNSAVPARASVRSTWPCNRIVIPTGA